MNSCVLMAEVVQDPQLRYTSDNQTPVAEVLVQFPGARSEDPMMTLKVVGWGNLAQQIQESLHPGDRVVLEGRLSMNLIDRPEGFKEKRAELIAQKFHLLGADTAFHTAVTSPAPGRSAPPTVAAPAPYQPTAPSPTAVRSVPPTSIPASSPIPPQAAPLVPPMDEPDYDDIPF